MKAGEMFKQLGLVKEVIDKPTEKLKTKIVKTRGEKKIKDLVQEKQDQDAGYKEQEVYEEGDK
jgi:hypothetical protein